MNESKPTQALAKAISAAAHPLLMPAFSLVMLYVFDGFLVHRTALFVYLMVVLLINSGAPAISLVMLKRRGYISDANISRREERIWPFLLVLAYQLAAWFLVHTQSQLEVPLFYQNMLLGLVVSIGCAWLVTLQFKVSMHMLAQGGVMAIYSHVVWRTGMFHDGWVATLIVLSGLVGWSRLTLNAHTQAELYAGYSLGYACVWLSLF